MGKAGTKEPLSRQQRASRTGGTARPGQVANPRMPSPTAAFPGAWGPTACPSLGKGSRGRRLADGLRQRRSQSQLAIWRGVEVAGGQGAQGAGRGTGRT